METIESEEKKTNNMNYMNMVFLNLLSHPSLEAAGLHNQPARGTLHDTSCTCILDHSCQHSRDGMRWHKAAKAAQSCWSLVMKFHGPMAWNYKQSQHNGITRTWDGLPPKITAFTHICGPWIVTPTAYPSNMPFQTHFPNPWHLVPQQRPKHPLTKSISSKLTCIA